MPLNFSFLRWDWREPSALMGGLNNTPKHTSTVQMG
ncbi:hypothetical protein GGE16_005820 [Rhizobium leguminosarum]|uniref:Uncharacterized protein n=1 Tax=Rhizobium leguminosarum TaxID=384 RepID=A0AAE2SZ37_RHILE|nr:hypothetical protein [Rhizobium leguminosarum]MBB4435206.1 hypothetical protein [Rhizobium esperanzae]MBB4299326.1 hypothetical protein [Rhizobium leguminosarum]MBB4310825.1 hypothetical protein [Rhizobium leguminosarum]MBB4420063.1 hypothetical protein [Rhizobium leguminosarum]